jgi:uncharacterized alkaline shock family protein YloU
VVFLEVFALVGPSGTGKSHRANIVAHNIGADVVIDDGLLIRDNKILAGISAKCQPTRIGAIKTALFMDDEHAQDVKEALASLNASKVLVLGTSDGMVEKIALRLGLPPVTKFLRIEDVASVKEIRKARMMRSQYSKHVIPAPTVEVRKTLPETLIDPLQVFLRRKGKTCSQNWLEQSVVRPTFTYYGKLSISQNALIYIAKIAAEQVEGVEAVKGIHLNRGDDGIILDIELILWLGGGLDIVGKNVQIAVKRQLENMTGLFVKSVNIVVVSVHEFKKAAGKH